MPAIGRGFDINDFRATMKRKGIARNNLYKLQITPPNGIVGIPRGAQNIEDIMVYCDSVTMPGLGLATSDSRPYGYGPVDVKAHTPTFNTMSASFIVDTKSYTLSFFRNWMRSIVNYTGEGKSYFSTQINGAVPFEASYKKDYATNMILYVLDSEIDSAGGTEVSVNIVSKTTIVRAFPIQIGDVVLSYGVTDQYLTLPVTFSYFDWYADSIAQTAGLSPPVAGTGSNNGDITQPKDIFGNPLQPTTPMGDSTGIGF